MSNHVTHLLPAYVNCELDRIKRDQVLRHVRVCAACQKALNEEESLTRDLKTWLPRMGRPTSGQIARLRTRVLSEAFALGRSAYSGHRFLSSIGVVLAALLVTAFVVSAMFGSPTNVSAAPNQFVPADIQATSTPVHTDSPSTVATLVALSMTPAPDQTLAVIGSPMAAPVPYTERQTY